LGKPILILAQDLADFVHEKRITQMHVSISDEKNLAAAFVVLEQ
jgi:holo-[acyl-carrier protein] synthase